MLQLLGLNIIPNYFFMFVNSDDPNLNNTNMEGLGKIDTIESLHLEVQRNLDGWKRAAADYQNLKKEMATKQEEWIPFAQSMVFRGLLPILFHMSQVFVHIPEDQMGSSWYTGLRNIQKQFDDFLRSSKIEKITTVGEIFNPSLHEAVGEEHHEDCRDHEIVTEVQPGYLLDGKLLIPARVIINSVT